MVFETVKWRRTYVTASDARPSGQGIRASRNRYDLFTALFIVCRMETSSTRGAVFAEIKRKNWLYRMVDRLYSGVGANTVQPFLLLLYMLKSALSVGPLRERDAEAIAIANFGNERHTIDRLTALVPDASVQRLSLRRRHLIGRGQIWAALRLAVAAPRIWPFLAGLARAHGFMPSARIASCLAYYIRFLQLFAESPRLGAAIIASNYSPEALGLAAAAHRTNRQVIYVNHAPVPANGAMVPPVLADCAVFYGDTIRKTYQSQSHCTAEVALIGQAGKSCPMEWQDEARSFGIFLTALTRVDVVAELVTAIFASRPDARVLIRNHPVALLKSDFSDLAARHGNLEISIGRRLDDEIADCDVVFCGNSGVALNVLRGGRPVAYLDALDGLNFDYNGFVESKLICEVAGWRDDLYAQLRNFYTNPAWGDVMRGYDASYGGDGTALERSAAEVIRRFIRPTPGPGSAVFRGQLPVQRSSPVPT